MRLYSCGQFRCLCETVKDCSEFLPRECCCCKDIHYAAGLAFVHTSRQNGRREFLRFQQPQFQASKCSQLLSHSLLCEKRCIERKLCAAPISLHIGRWILTFKCGMRWAGHATQLFVVPTLCSAFMTIPRKASNHLDAKPCPYWWQSIKNCLNPLIVKHVNHCQKLMIS